MRKYQRSPQPVSNVKNLHERHNSRIGKGILQRNKFTGIPSVSSAAQKREEYKSVKKEINKTAYSSRVSILDKGPSIKPQMTDIKPQMKRMVSHTSLSASYHTKDYSRKSNQRTVKHDFRESFRKSTVAGSESKKNESRVVRSRAEYNPRPIGVSPKPIMVSPRMDSFNDVAPDPAANTPV